MFSDVSNIVRRTVGTQRIRLMRFTWVALAWFGGLVSHSIYVQVKRGDNIPRDSVRALAAATDYKSRHAAKTAIMRRHREDVKLLGELLNQGEGRAAVFNRETAAEILGQYNAIAAMPSLVRNLSFHSPLSVVEAKWFYIEHYPCAQAIIDMGPSALDPFLWELRGPNGNELSAGVSREAWTRKYSDIEVELAARIVLTLCEGDFDRARKKVTETEKVAIPKEVFIRMRYQLDHVLNKPGHLQHEKKPPTA